jgi:phage shock protein PspC (stress-responsive transcriptional regulator)
MKPLRWVRTVDDKWVAGVAGGTAKAMDLSPGLMRFLWILAILFSAGLALIFYLGCVIALPRADRSATAREKMVLGVCARVDARGDMEVGLARLLALVLLMATGGAAIIGYIVLHFVLDQPARV